MVLLYIQLTISFLIGRKRTVNFLNQRLGRHLPADYTLIMSWMLKIMGNHVMYAVFSLNFSSAGKGPFMDGKAKKYILF